MLDDFVLSIAIAAAAVGCGLIVDSLFCLVLGFEFCSGFFWH